ncbi:voltage-dependent calcium channel subunit alpha-2/delta-3 isoform X1 [Tachysurus ichikawai]
MSRLCVSSGGCYGLNLSSGCVWGGVKTLSASSPDSDHTHRVTLYDYQAICRIYAESSDSSSCLLDPYFAFYATVKWLLTELIM